jgi:glycosyltransferase involved in cell wall biosynthesis
MSQRLPKHPYPAQVVTLHEHYPAVSKGHSTPEFQRMMSRRIEHAIRNANRIIAVSESVRQRLIEHDSSLGPRIRMVHHGVERAQPASEDEVRRFREQALGFGADEKFFLNVGAIQVRKNIINIASALKELPGYRLVVAGGDGFGAQKIHEFIRKEALGDRIRILGHRQPAELRLLYSTASALVFPSFEEAFGLPILEAMSYGLPVITSNVSGMKEIGGEAALLVDPHRVEEIKNAMQRVMEDEETARVFVERGRWRASQFTWEKCAAQTWEVYRDLSEI